MQCCTTNDIHYNVYWQLFFQKNIKLWNRMQNSRENMKQKAKSFGTCSTALFPYNFNVTLMLIYM